MAPKRKTKRSPNARKVSPKAGSRRVAKTNDTLQDEIFLVIALVASILLFLSNFNLVGVFGRLVSDIIFGLVGMVAYILPFIVFFTTAFHISNKGNRRAGRKILSVFVFFIALASLVQLITQIEELNSYDIFRYYTVSSEKHSGGGLIGGIFAKLIMELFGKVGAYIILIALMLLSIIVITGKAILTHLAGKSREVLKERRDNYRLRREQMEDEQEEDLSPERPNVRPGRRVAKTFVIDKTSTPSLSGTGVSISDKPEEAAGKKKAVVYNLSDFQKNSNKVITYEDELRAKFGSSEADENSTVSTAELDFTEAFAGYNTGVVDETTSVEDVSAGAVSITEENGAKSYNRDEASDKAGKDKIDSLNIDQKPQEKEYVFPPVSLLAAGRNKGVKGAATEKHLKETAMKLQSTLESFGVHVTVTNASIGPAVTRYELTPEQGVRVNEITRLADDIKLNLAASEIRIEAPIPGKSAVGIEVPNKENTVVTLREIIEAREFSEYKSGIVFAVGKDIGGQPVVADIAKMPHLLIAGATGSGKSVCINTLIMSILYKYSPADVRLIMVDPKVVELSVYNGIPHLLIPVVTDPKKAAAALHWAVAEMTERYKKFADLNVKDLKGYNERVAEVAHLGDENYQKMPQIVIIIDELADLMMVAQNEVEDAICRLAQLARAAGLHLVIATQRPSVNVITGLIKANIPSRIAFAVSSQVDSRTILDGAGAEKLLGKGDMLFFPSGFPKPVRVQGAFVSDKEVNAVVDFLKKNNTEASYSEEIHEKITNAKAGEGFMQGASSERDEYFAEAGRFIIEKDKASIGMLQRVYKIGFNRAARIMDQLAEAGVVGPEEGTKPRKILMTLEQFEQYLEEN